MAHAVPLHQVLRTARPVQGTSKQELTINTKQDAVSTDAVSTIERRPQPGPNWHIKPQDHPILRRYPLTNTAGAKSVTLSFHHRNRT